MDNRQNTNFPFDLADNAVNFVVSGQSPEPVHEPEGELAVDVYQTEEELAVVAAMAGTPAENIELHLHNDLLTIRGERVSPFPNAEHYCQECFWGKFSKTIILPVEIKAELARAEYKNGLLTVWLPKVKSDSNIPIIVIED